MYLGARAETRLMYNNALINASLVLSTSHRDGFDETNITSANRTALYIPNDVFTIDTTNQSFKFRVGTGANITVVLDQGSYTGTTLAAHMQTKFANNFLITYDTTTKMFGIRHATLPYVLLTGEYPVSWDTIGFTSGSDFYGNPTSMNTQHYGDKARRHTDIKLYYNLGAAADCSFFALLGERNKTNSLSPSATINIKLSNINDITTAAYSIDLTAPVNGTYSFLDGIIGNSTFRYFWLTIKDRENTSEYLAFSQLFLGSFVCWPNRTIDHGFTLQYLDRSIRTESVSGALFFERYNKYPYLSNLKISYLNRDDIALLQQAWYDLGKSEHFYISLDSGWMNGDINEFTFFGVFDSDPTIEEVGPRYFNASFSFRGD
jgi:hypothetical protein